MSDWSEGLLGAADMAGTAFTGIPLGSVISAAGSIFGAGQANSAQQDSNKQAWDIFGAQAQFNEREAQKNRDFQERMANTSWVRGTQDMKNAGINPMVSFSQGGAPTPAGNAAQVSQGQVGPSGKMAALQTAQQVAQVLSQIRMQDAQTTKLNAEKANVDADTQLKYSQASTTQEYGRTSIADRMLKGTQQSHTQADIGRINNEALRIASQTDINAELKKKVIEEIKNAQAENKLIGARTGNFEIDTQLMRLAERAAKNAEAVAKTPFGEAAAYGKALGEIGSGVSNAAGAYRGLRSLGR